MGMMMARDNAMVSLLSSVGPVSDGFVNDQRFITGIMGPYGSAKTTSCIRKIINSLFWQTPSRDGVRRARWCVVRDTYQQLETNVLNSWFTWFPKIDANFNIRAMRDRQRFEVVRYDAAGQPVRETIELEMYFRAMGDQKAEQVLKGLELTGLWLNEVDTLDASVLRFGLPRTGRYPSAKDGGCAWSGVICDMNAPDIDNWTYDLLVDQNLPLEPDQLDELRAAIGPRFGIGFHAQPGGRSINPPPENIQNLAEGYYQTMMLGLTAADIRRFVDNEFGAVRQGQPVYPEYNDELHCAALPLKAVAGVPVCVGLDGGATPAMVFGQRLPSGQILTLSELVIYAPNADAVLEKMGPEQFGLMAREHWAEHYGRCSFGGGWADPSAWYGQTDDFSWVKSFEKGFGFKVKPAPVKANRLTPRLEAVRGGLMRNCGNQPGQLISPTCRVLRRGFKSGYVIERLQFSNGQGRWKDEPVKNDFSHVHDAKQYLDLGLTLRGDALADVETRQRPAPKGKTNFGAGFFAHKPSSPVNRRV
jgi:hypothetical protein